MLLIYKYNDMSHFILSPDTKIDWGINYIYWFLSQKISILLLNNIFVLLMVICSIYCFYILSRYLKVSKVLSVIGSLTFAFSPYFLLRVVSFTPGLYPIFVFPLFVYLLISKRSVIIQGIVVLITLLCANYYGFFLFVISLLWNLINWVIHKETKQFLKNIGFLVLIVVLPILVFTFSLVKSNLPIFGNYKNVENPVALNQENNSVFYRPIEDFYNLSLRPWYFLIPPKTSLFFSALSQNYYDSLESTGHYLTDDYTEEEMGGSFIGWHYFVGLSIVIFLVFVYFLSKTNTKKLTFIEENKVLLLKLLILLACIFLLSGPPSFTIHGYKVYTPTFLLYYLVPVFRTLSRWSVVIFMLVLLVNSILLEAVFIKVNNRIFRFFVCGGLVALNFVTFSIKLPVINTSKPPEEIAYVLGEFPGTDNYMVFPKGDYYSIFWSSVLKDRLLNQKDLTEGSIDPFIDSFYANMFRPGSLGNLRERDVKYIIFYPEQVTENILNNINKVDETIINVYDIDKYIQSELGTKVFDSPSAQVYIIK